MRRHSWVTCALVVLAAGVRVDAAELSTPVVRALDGGTASLAHTPMALVPGSALLVIEVRDAAGEYRAGASLSAFLYPRGAPGEGRNLSVSVLRTGYFVLQPTLDAPGQYELALRVVRGGRPDEVVYFPLVVAPPPDVTPADEFVAGYGAGLGPMAAPVIAEIPAGRVIMTHRPARLGLGIAQIDLFVEDAAAERDEGATITAALTDPESATRALAPLPRGPGHFTLRAILAMRGAHALTVQVERPGLEAATLAFPLAVGG